MFKNRYSKYRLSQQENPIFTKSLTYMSLLPMYTDLSKHLAHLTPCATAAKLTLKFLIVHVNWFQPQSSESQARRSIHTYTIMRADSIERVPLVDCVGLRNHFDAHAPFARGIVQKPNAPTIHRNTRSVRMLVLFRELIALVLLLHCASENVFLLSRTCWCM